MKPNETHDREILSALFDGALDDEARLFAMRRLSHDTSWQTECGRWQMIGDVMRRQAPIAASADLAARVRAGIDAAPVALAVAPPVAGVAAPRHRRARMWAGGALAASLALVGIVSLQSTRGVPAAPTVVAASAEVAPASAPEAPQVASTGPVAGVGPVEAASAEPAPGAVAAPISVAAAAPVLASRITRRAPATASRSDTGDATSRPATDALVADAGNPFHVPAADPLSARPWPRAAVSPAATPFTASFGERGAAGPSFFPFEPRPQAAATADASP